MGLDHNRRVKPLPATITTRCRDTRVSLVDVGASGGLPETWEPHRAALRIIGFEPDAGAHAALEAGKRDNETWFNFGLHNSAGRVDFFVTRKQACSSCLPPNRAVIDRFPNPDRFDILEKTSLECERLDTLLSTAQHPGADFLKIDTQGSELAILEGAEHTLRDAVFGVEVEVNFVELYEGRPEPGEIDATLRGLGFDLIDLRTVTWKRKSGALLGGSKGQLVFGDALYFKRPEAVVEMIGKSEPLDGLVRAVSICLIYGYVDYALELVEQCAGIVREDEVRELDRYIRSHEGPGQRLPNFPGRAALSSLALRTHQLLSPRRYRQSQQPLGNRLRTR